MELTHDIIRKHFESYLDKFRKLSDIAPFSLAYIRLLLLFENELSQVELSVILERQKQLRGEEFDDERFDELRGSSLKEVNRNSANNTSRTREAMLSHLLFCTMLDTEENDFFYLTEPMFDFVGILEVSPCQLLNILEAEFDGFKILS